MYNTNQLHKPGSVDVGHAVSYDDLRANNFYAIFPMSATGNSAATDRNTWFASFAESERRDEHGAFAARLSVEAIYEHLLQPNSAEFSMRKKLESSLQHAHKTLRRQSHNKKHHSGYQAAILSSCITDNRFYVTYSGDVRAYLFRNNLIYHLTHAVAPDRKPASNASMGMGREIEPALVPTYQPPGAQEQLTVNHISFNLPTQQSGYQAVSSPQIIDHLPLSKNDVIAICSASVSRAVPPLQIDEFSKACLPQQAAERVVNLASLIDKDPNHSIIILRQR